MLGLREWSFELFLLKKTGYNSGENDGNGKKFKLVLNTIYKKIFPKYQPKVSFIVLGLREWILELI